MDVWQYDIWDNEWAHFPLQEYDPLLGSAIACVPPLSPSSPTSVFFASGPQLHTLSIHCSTVVSMLVVTQEPMAYSLTTH